VPGLTNQSYRVTSELCKYFVSKPDSSASYRMVSTSHRGTSAAGTVGRPFALCSGMTTRRLRFVIFQDAPGLWVIRGLEHDLAAEARTIGQALRSIARLVQAHTEFDLRHDHLPLSAFPPSAQTYWNAYAAGTQIPLSQLGVVPPAGWDIQAAFATRLPCDQRHRPAQLRYALTA
jgi:hypothetical protein